MKYSSVADIVQDLEERPVERGGHVYHPIPFPEFAHLTTSTQQEGLSAKLRLVRRVLECHFGASLDGVRVVDIGASAGLFTFTLAREGAHVTAYEPHPRYGPIGAYLARAKNLPVDWREEAFDLGAAQRNYDAALMLSSFQWITRGNARLDEGKALLRELSKHVGVLVFELGIDRGKSAVRTRRLNPIAFIYDLLRASTTYRHIRLAGSSRIWKRGRRYVFVCANEALVKEPWYASVKYIRV